SATAYPSRLTLSLHDALPIYLALKDLSGVAVDDFRRGAEENPHGEHRALAHDHAFRDLGTRADEAMVLDDDRVRLQRLEHAADRSEEHTSELQSPDHLVCRLL